MGTGLGLLILSSLYFMLPAYLANASPVVFKGILKGLAKPVDMGIKFRNRPLFGSHKTYRGLIAAALVGIIVFLLQRYLYQYPFFQNWSIMDYDYFYSQYSVLPGFLLGFGAIFGDLIKSFFKRQFDVGSGERWLPWDQLDFLIGALVFISFIYVPEWQVILALFILTPMIHIAVSHIAFYLKIREVKW